ncbi:hypothetical protein QUF75_15905 [Desulfococcaceae bacterium HSG7]|nr:hypothetical protein [Desulfococcaceae bacterium HSG7]
MQSDRNKILVESIKRLLRRDATTHLQKIVNKTHGADLSVVFGSLPVQYQHKLFETSRLNRRNIWSFVAALVAPA